MIPIQTFCPIITTLEEYKIISTLRMTILIPQKIISFPSSQFKAQVLQMFLEPLQCYGLRQKEVTFKICFYYQSVRAVSKEIERCRDPHTHTQRKTERLRLEGYRGQEGPPPPTLDETVPKLSLNHGCFIYFKTDTRSKPTVSVPCIHFLN